MNLIRTIVSGIYGVIGAALGFGVVYMIVGWTQVGLILIAVALFLWATDAVLVSAWLHRRRWRKAHTLGWRETSSWWERTRGYAP